VNIEKSFYPMVSVGCVEYESNEQSSSSSGIEDFDRKKKGLLKEMKVFIIFSRGLELYADESLLKYLEGK